MNRMSLVLTAALGAAASWTFAAGDVPQAAAPAGAAASAGAYTDGLIKKIDLEQGKVTLQHGRIENLGMPGMTMVFHADPRRLASFKVGEAVKFKADRLGGAIQLTELLAR